MAGRKAVSAGFVKVMCCLLLMGWMTCTAGAAEHVWLIGGGGSLHSSQAQIEKNVIWAGEVLRDLPGKRTLHIYFTDGDDARPDVIEWAPPAETVESMQPLARVFDTYMANGDNYRNHRVPDVSGGTEAGSLSARLAQEFSRLTAGDRVLFVFNGHGGHENGDPAGNTMELWNRTSLSARELEALMTRIRDDVPVRFLFTQCYSGGFARLVHPGARDVPELAAARRCGFLAEGADRQAEGCSAGVDIDDYRDYSTYFFAALQGRTRQGGPLPVSADRNGDGATSLYEAHLYALRAGHSSDLPRATSEVYLERWEPWYMRWFGIGKRDEVDNIYATLARELAQAAGLPVADPDLYHAIVAKRREHNARLSQLQQERRFARRYIAELREPLQVAVEARWPEAGQPHTAAYASFLATSAAAAQDFIAHAKAYPELVANQKRYWELGDEILAVERDLTQLEKIERMQRLGQVLDAFERHADPQQKAAYQRLIGCEQGVL